MPPQIKEEAAEMTQDEDGGPVAWKNGRVTHEKNAEKLNAESASPSFDANASEEDRQDDSLLYPTLKELLEQARLATTAADRIAAWTTAANEYQSVQAMLGLATWYEQQQDDKEKAVAWYERALAQCPVHRKKTPLAHPDLSHEQRRHVQKQLGLFLCGCGSNTNNTQNQQSPTPVDIAKAIHYLELAAQDGCLESMKFLGHQYIAAAGQGEAPNDSDVLLLSGWPSDGPHQGKDWLVQAVTECRDGPAAFSLYEWYARLAANNNHYYYFYQEAQQAWLAIAYQLGYHPAKLAWNEFQATATKRGWVRQRDAIRQLQELLQLQQQSGAAIANEKRMSAEYAQQLQALLTCGNPSCSSSTATKTLAPVLCPVSHSVTYCCPACQDQHWGEGGFSKEAEIWRTDRALWNKLMQTLGCSLSPNRPSSSTKKKQANVTSESIEEVVRRLNMEEAASADEKKAGNTSEGSATADAITSDSNSREPIQAISLWEQGLYPLKISVEQFPLYQQRATVAPLPRALGIDLMVCLGEGGMRMSADGCDTIQCLMTDPKTGHCIHPWQRVIEATLVRTDPSEHYTQSDHALLKNYLSNLLMFWKRPGAPAPPPILLSPRGLQMFVRDYLNKRYLNSPDVAPLDELRTVLAPRIRLVGLKQKGDLNGQFGFLGRTTMIDGKKRAQIYLDRGGSPIAVKEHNIEILPEDPRLTMVCEPERGPKEPAG